MAWKYTTLVNTLSGLYSRTNDIQALLERANFRVGDFVLDGSSAKVIWTFAVRRIEQLNRMKDLLTVALEDYPDNPVLLSYNNDVDSGQDNDYAGPNGVYAGPEPAWQGQVPKVQFEKITGEQNTFLDLSFLQEGLIKADAVARVLTPKGLGTGFLIADTNLLLTNNHVIGQKPTPGAYKARFNYQKTLNGLAAEFEDLEIDDSVFHTSPEHDWTVVKVKGNPAAKYGFIPLKEVQVKNKEFVNIIQHPGGEFKKIAFYHNLVTFVNNQRVQYLTDTMPGSSGSPVFNSAWEVVALHHSGGWLEEPGRPGMAAALRNEGIHINLVLNSLRAEGLLH